MSVAKSIVIETRDIRKNYVTDGNPVEALKGISIKIPARSFTVVFGPSGCGKSTLLALIGGLDVATEGKVFIRGEDLSGLSLKDLARHRRQKIGYVFQLYNLIPSLTVLENVALPLAFAGKPLLQRKRRAKKLLELVGLQDLGHRYPTELSGGQQQMVSIVRALANNPWILLVDEPTGNLDSKSAQEVMSFLYDLNRKSRRTILLVTHNPEFVSIAQDVYYMKDGKIVKHERISRRKRKLAKSILKDDRALSEEGLEKL